MALERFRITNQKAIVVADCPSVPQVMVIAGPNGVGKSTLLHAIKQQRGDIIVSGEILYIPAHRIWRRQQLTLNNLWSIPQTLASFLTQDTIAAFAGLRILDGARTPDSADEALSAVKHVLSQFETRKLTAQDTLLKAKGTISLDDVGDVYTPVRELTRFLLPHLQFSHISTTSRDNVRCLFRRTDRASSIEVDLDDLSSGERSIISLFMPFLEKQIGARLSALETGISALSLAGEPDMVVIIDEPELHLHPLLQGRLLEYLRALTVRGGVQFVLATQSPTLVNVADFGELYVLTPPTDHPQYNQLVQLASSEERLTALRDLSGDTYVLTACKNIICVEGELPSADVKEATDVRILELICPEITAAHILLPFGSKGEAIKAMRGLRRMLTSVLPLLSVSALVDADQSDNAPDQSGVFLLPVSMIENMLLMPEAIWRVIAPQKEKVGLYSCAEIEATLQEIALARREIEISLRVQRSLKAHTVRIQGHTIEQLQESVRREIENVENFLPDEAALQEIIRHATEAVDRIIEDNKMLIRFHGKEILAQFYKRYGNKTGIGREALALQIARTIGEDDKLRKPIAEALSNLISTFNNDPSTTSERASAPYA